MFDELGSVFMAFESCCKVIDKTDANLAKSLVCMLIDYIGAKENISSVEIIDEIRPIIADVNASMGTMKIA